MKGGKAQLENVLFGNAYAWYALSPQRNLLLTVVTAQASLPKGVALPGEEESCGQQGHQANLHAGDDLA